jgi:hypothetical protein
MPGSRASVFGEVEDFLAALSADGVTEMLPTGRGQFQARVTQVGLERLRLAAVEEAQSRIAFITVPAGMVLVSFPVNGGPSPIWGGVEIRAGEMITLGPGQRVHARTVGPCRWHVVQVPERQLADYGRALSGARFIVRPAARWRPRRSALRQLRHFHRAAIRMAEARAGALTDLQGAHGLEQLRRSACRSERSASAAKSIWGRVRAAIAASAQRSRCTSLCEAELRMRPAFRKSLGDTASANSVASPPITVSSTASCHRSRCGEVWVGTRCACSDVVGSEIRGG